MAKLLSRTVREVDIVARYGGEEFVLVLPDARVGAAKAIVERLRIAVRGHPFFGAQAQPSRRVTVSGGLAELGTGSSSAADLLRNADAMLYEAKRAGRDRIRVWRADQGPASDPE